MTDDSFKPKSELIKLSTVCKCCTRGFQELSRPDQWENTYHSNGTLVTGAHWEQLLEPHLVCNSH
jgi:hypothetical protein